MGLGFRVSGFGFRENRKPLKYDISGFYSSFMKKGATRVDGSLQIMGCLAWGFHNFRGLGSFPGWCVGFAVEGSGA